MIGRDVSVLFEKTGRQADQMGGKSEYLHAVHVTDPTVQIGEMRRVRIIESRTNSLSGVVLG
jgi:tRNA-2-methylthio-N6-dimethylallyladenosine synthase